MNKLSINFYRHEFSCKCNCGFDTVDVKLVEVLQHIRDHFGASVTVTSGCRCKSYNAEVGGSNKSQHTMGRAADIVVEGIAPEYVANLAEQYMGDTGGIGRYPDFTHIDTRTGCARWGSN